MVGRSLELVNVTEPNLLKENGLWPKLETHPLCAFASPSHAWETPALCLGFFSCSLPLPALVTPAVISPRLWGTVAVCPWVINPAGLWLISFGASQLYILKLFVFNL